MRKKIFEGNINGRDCRIIKDISLKKGFNTKYYFYLGVPNDRDSVELIRKQIRKHNERVEDNKRHSLVGIDVNGVRTPFVKQPISKQKVEKLMSEFGNVNELKENNSNGAVNSNKKKVIAVAGVALVLAATILGSVMIGQNTNGDVSTGEVTTPTHQVVETTVSPITTTAPTTGTTSDQITSQDKQDEIDFDSIDLDSLKCDVYQNSAGNTMYELDDSLFISYVCYNKLVNALNDYNASVSADKQYSFDASKFNSTMFTAEQIRESSLKQTRNDINDLCRGPFKIGPDAMKEANIVSKNLFGTEILESEEDLYDPVKSCMACMCIAVKNYEYCAGVTNNVTPNMVYDTYLYGCGNIRKQLRNGTYSPTFYSREILGYGEVLEDYLNSLTSGKTDGSHDSVWKDCYQQLWKVPSMVKEAQPGE